jgi:tRNA (cytidine32/uridine32-2'-O)-methyltransferase
MSFDKIRIVLVEPLHPGNIGAVARAMKAMDLHRLTLVRPGEFPADEADRRAVAAVDILDRAQVVETLVDAVADCQLVIGSTARARSWAHPVIDARQAGKQLTEQAALGDEVAVVFGNERAGLTNEELNACNFELRIPTSKDFKSLNLGSAVQILAYEIYMASMNAAPAHDRDVEYPDTQTFEYFYKHLETALDSRDYFKGDGREAGLIKIRRLFARSRPDVAELKRLHSLVTLMELPEDE